MKNKAIKYKEEDSEFYNTLKERIDNYFKERNISRYANGKMVFKSVICMLLFFGSYALIISDKFSPAVMLILTIVFGISSILVLGNILHDASHNAYSNNPKIDKFLASFMYMIGCSAYIWLVTHDCIHHATTNVPSYD